MLYITTRNTRDAFTAQRALHGNRGPDGGMYLPFRAPEFTAEDITKLAQIPFGQRVAEVLNRLFQTKLTTWDVDFCIGRNPVRFAPLGHRIQVAELWHNPGSSYSHMERELSEQLLTGQTCDSGWLPIALRIAILFGVYGELRKQDSACVDISLLSGDFSAPISAYYARQWGLPVGNIICCCNENSELWNLLCHGQLHTDVTSIPTLIPEADPAIPEHLERLIFDAGGVGEVERYLEASRRGGTYTPNDAVQAKMNRGLSVSVVSSHRIKQIIPSVFRTHNYVLAPGAALSYAGLMDYRAKTGQTRNAVILADESPALNADFIANSLGVASETLRDLI